jgi:hypothetical protein
MSLHAQEQFLAAVAAALGESISLIRRRGFHLEIEPLDLDLRPARGSTAAAPPIDDAVDLAACGLDWDADDGSRSARRRRRVAARRRAA